MPIYEYQCKACSHCFEALVLSAGEPPPQCPECRCADVEKLLSAGCIRSREAYTGAGGIHEPFRKPVVG